MVSSHWIDPIPGLWREEESHRYWLDEHLFPVSITGVLAHRLSGTAKRAIEAKRSIWEPRGLAVHAALEHYSQARFLVGMNPEEALLCVEELPDHHSYRDWILPLLQLPLWDGVEVIASERLTCCADRNLAGAFDGAYLARRPAAAADSGEGARELRVLYDLKTLSAHGRPYSTAAQLGGYMVLEAAQGNHYDAGQTIWSKPGGAWVSGFYSREDCLAAWAGAWSRYSSATRPF